MPTLLSETFANQPPSDIRLPAGVSHFVIIDTNAYSGNFEREMGAYAMGAFDDDGYHGRKEYEMFQEARTKKPQLAIINNKVQSMEHADYGEVYTAIWATPGRLNDGNGKHFADTGITQAWPAYESVGLCVCRPLTAEELPLVLSRAQEYMAMYVVDSSRRSVSTNGCTVAQIRQLSFEVKRTTSIQRI